MSEERTLLRVALFVAWAVGLSFATAFAAYGMTFDRSAPLTVHASGPIEEGDAAQFAALPKFDVLELDSPGGLVSEALSIAANMDSRGGIRTEVKPGSPCASACAMALFVSGATRVVDMGGRLGIHSCSMPDGTPVPECNELMAANATSHGVPWGVIEGLGNYTDPSNMAWIGAEEAECLGLMKWSAEDTSNDGIACFQYNLLTTESGKPAEVTEATANDVLCRLNAGTSSIFVPTGDDDQGFSDAYRKACERIAADPATPKYAAIDILMWLTLTDPDVWSIKPGTLTAQILDNDDDLANNCWKCLTILGMTYLAHGYPQEGLGVFQRAMAVVRRDTGAVPEWLSSRANLAAQSIKGNKGSSGGTIQ